MEAESVDDSKFFHEHQMSQLATCNVDCQTPMMAPPPSYSGEQQSIVVASAITSTMNHQQRCGQIVVTTGHQVQADYHQPLLPSQIAFNATNQQLVPIAIPVNMPPPSFIVDNRGGVNYYNEPAEAPISRVLALLSLFCWFQLWFSIPALVISCRRNKPRSVYKLSIALSITAIVLGMIAAFIMMSAGLALPAVRTFYYSATVFPTSSWQN